MSLRFHEIAETGHRIQNPLNVDKLTLLGEICALEEGMRVLDLACGKGELLVDWARNFNVFGVGVDISEVFIGAAKQRAYQADVGNKLNFVIGDAGEYPEPHHEFDVVCCLGATWIGGGLTGTLNLMRIALKSHDGWLVVGEPYWREEPSSAVCEALNVGKEDFASLPGTLDRFESAGLELVEMVLANEQDWDRYEAQQWRNVHQFLADHPDDVDAHALKAWNANNRRTYLTYGRQIMGWGVFVLRQTRPLAGRPQPLENPNRPVGLDISDGMLWMRLQDGRVIGNPLAWYPWLQAASAEEIDTFELTVIGIEWPLLKQRLEVSAMLRSRG